MILKASVTILPVHRDRCLRYEFQFTMYLLNTFTPLFMDEELSFKGNTCLYFQQTSEFCQIATLKLYN